MSLASYAQELEEYKAAVERWKNGELRRARQTGKALLLQRDMLVEKAAENGANKRSIQRDLARPEIGPALSIDGDEGPAPEPDKPLFARPAEPAGEAGES